MRNIFVNICSYRDKFLGLTLNSLIENESKRNTITYGIFEQIDYEESLEVKYPKLFYHPSVKYKRIDPKYSDGVVWARSINSMQMRDEEFYYQVDSHMLFDKDWDNYLIFDYMQAQEFERSEKIIITAGTMNYSYENGKILKHKFDEEITTKVGYLHFADGGGTQLNAHAEWIKRTDSVQPGIHICAGNFFTTSKWITEIGYDPRIFFSGEEQIMSLKSLLNGYKIYHPRQIKCYHYMNTANYDTKPYVKPVIKQHKLESLQYDSWKYMNDFIYSLGEDKLMEFKRLTGVDYINKELEERAVCNIQYANNSPSPKFTIKR